MDRKIWYIITGFWAVLFTASIVYEVPDASWKQEKVVEDVDNRFIDLELTGSQLNLVYRDSTDSGVMLKTMKAESGLIDSLRNFVEKDAWSREQVIDQSSGSGSYLSAANVDGKLMVAYQDASVGSERVILASKTGSNWSRQTVDDVTNGGVNVGMYTSLTSYQENPMVLYHSPTQGLKAATRENGEWAKQVIAEDMGWFTDSTSCGEKVFAAYRGRNSQDLKLSAYDGTWSTEDLNSTVKSSLSITQQNCQPHILHLKQSEQIVYIDQDKEEEVITDSAYSSVSIQAKNGIHTSYYNYGEGMFYAHREGENRDKKKLTNSSNTGKYNDLAIDQNGNIHVVFTQNSDIVHAEKNAGRIENLNRAVRYLRIFLGIVLGLLILQTLRKTRLLNPKHWRGRKNE